MAEVGRLAALAPAKYQVEIVAAARRLGQDPIEIIHTKNSYQKFIPRKFPWPDFLGAFRVFFSCPSDRAIRMRVASVAVGPCPSYLPTNLLLRTGGADPGRRKAAAQEARGARTFALTLAPATTPIPVGNPVEE